MTGWCWNRQKKENFFSVFFYKFPPLAYNVRKGVREETCTTRIYKYLIKSVFLIYSHIFSGILKTYFRNVKSCFHSKPFKLDFVSLIEFCGKFSPTLAKYSFRNWKSQKVFFIQSKSIMEIKNQNLTA